MIGQKIHIGTAASQKPAAIRKFIGAAKNIGEKLKRYSYKVALPAAIFSAIGFSGCEQENGQYPRPQVLLFPLDSAPLNIVPVRDSLAVGLGDTFNAEKITGGTISFRLKSTSVLDSNAVVKGSFGKDTNLTSDRLSIGKYCQFFVINYSDKASYLYVNSVSDTSANISVFAKEQ